MTLDDLATQLRALRDVVASLANVGRLEEYALVAWERLALGRVEQARAAGLAQPDILAAAAPLLQAFISIGENVELPLSDETEDLIRDAKAVGVPLRESQPRQPSRPLSAAPQGPPEFSVFVDESGTASFDEASQPVLCLAGVIVKDDAILDFEREAERLLERYGLPKDIEFHAWKFLGLTPAGPLATLDVSERYALLREFLTRGMNRVSGVHQMPMLKEMVKPEVRQRMLAKGLDAYSQTVLWFVLTLDRACLLVTMPGRYKYFYDRTDDHGEDVAAILTEIQTTPKKGLRLLALTGQPSMLESHQSRFIQLADVAAYYLNRYHQFGVRTFKHRPELDKHLPKILEMYELIKPKLVDFIGKDLHLTIDWKALADFSLPPRTPRPPAGRRRRRR